MMTLRKFHYTPEDLYPTKRMLNDLRHQQSMNPPDVHTAKRKKETEYFIQKPFEFRPKNYLWNNPKPPSLFFSPKARSGQHERQIQIRNNTFREGGFWKSPCFFEHGLLPTNKINGGIENTPIIVYDRQALRNAQIQNIINKSYEMRGQIPHSNRGITGALSMHLGRLAGAAVSAYDFASSTITCLTEPHIAIMGIWNVCKDPKGTGSQVFRDALMLWKQYPTPWGIQNFVQLLKD